MRRIRIVGLTGGIASGKSTAARVLEKRGVPVIDADLLAREVVEPGTPALAEIAARWPKVIGSNGRLDRGALGARVFSDPLRLRELETLTLPRILEALEARVGELEARGEAIAIFQAPILLERDLEDRVDGVLLVSLSPELQLERLRHRSGLTEREARDRLASQLPLEEKRARARWILENEGTPEELEAALSRLWPRIRRELLGND